MLNIHKAYFCIFCLGLVSLLTAPVMFLLSDELMLAAFAVLAGFDMLYNRNLRRYRLLFALTGVMLFYLFYSLAASAYNTAFAKVYDFILQSKPLVAFAVSYAIAPAFTPKEKYALKKLCIVLSVIAFSILFLEHPHKLIGHSYYVGLLCAACAAAYLLVSFDEENPEGFSQKDRLWAVAILLLGLSCTRAKYYGFCVLSLYLLFVYVPGTVNLKSVRNIVVSVLALAAVVLVAWKKIEYYFLGNGLDSFDPDVAQSFARPALYGGMLLVLADRLFLGSGLASFATFSSSTNVNYSALYDEYGLSMVWGLCPAKDDFISDAFYPELAQFGLVGIFFFLFFCRWIWRKFRLVMRVKGMYLFVVGVMCFSLLAIDGVAGSSVVQASGEMLMAVMGIVAGTVKHISKKEADAMLRRPISEFYENKKRIKRYGYEC